MFVYVSEHWLVFAEEADLKEEVEKTYHGRIWYPYCYNAVYINTFLLTIATEISVAARSKAWVYGRSLAGIAGSNPAVGAWMSVSCVCCVL